MTFSLLAQQLDALLTNETNFIANLSNASALLNDNLTDINWVGFYLYDENTKQLHLGPFQGKVACMHIEFNKGVCGSAVAQQKTLRIDDVHQFAGHIACDSASNSEIVIPLIKDGKILGVLDIDSPKFARFSSADQAQLEEFVKVLLTHL